MIYKIITAPGIEPVVYARVDDDGLIRFSCIADNPEFQEWLSAGNEPEQYEEPPPAPDYFAFWDALLVSNVYQSIRSQALTNPAVLVACTEFIAAIGDAKAGRTNISAIQTCINYLMTSGVFTSDHLQELESVLEVGHLQDIYSLGVPLLVGQ